MNTGKGLHSLPPDKAGAEPGADRPMCCLCLECTRGEKPSRNPLFSPGRGGTFVLTSFHRVRKRNPKYNAIRHICLQKKLSNSQVPHAGASTATTPNKDLDRGVSLPDSNLNSSPVVKPTFGFQCMWLCSVFAPGGNTGKAVQTQSVF